MADILNGNPPQVAAAADLEQVQALAGAVLDGRLGDEGRGTLERLVVRHRATARQDLRSADLDGDGR